MEKLMEGFIKIPNKLYGEIITFRLSGELSQIFHFIIRKTLGFNKTRDSIANLQIIQATGLNKGNVSRGLSKLIKHKIVIKTDNFSKKGHALEINLNTKEWIGLVIKKATKIKVVKRLSKKQPKLSVLQPKVIKTDNKRLSKVRDTIDNKIHSKDNIQNTAEKTGSKEPTPKQKTELFFKGVNDLKKGDQVDWLKVMLRGIADRNKNIGPGKLWNEVQDFTLYWTEKTQDGKRSRWQMERTFEVDRRLVTWMNRAFKGFSKNNLTINQNKGKKINI